MQTQLQWNDLHTPYSRVTFRVTLRELAKSSMTRSIALSLCNSSYYSVVTMAVSCIVSEIKWALSRKRYVCISTVSDILNVNNSVTVKSIG